MEYRHSTSICTGTCIGPNYDTAHTRFRVSIISPMNQTEEASLDTLTWKPDVLGKNYEHARLQLDKDPDTGHAPEAVLVRDVRSSTSNKPAMLWVHGMSDYFFHNHVADEFVSTLR